MKLATLIVEAGVEINQHVLDEWADQDIPMSGGLVAQGDVVFIPEAIAAGNGVGPTGQGVPVTSRVLVDGMHPHTLWADEDVCRYTDQVDDTERLAVGVIDAAAPVFVLHAEHGAVCLAPGRWVVRRSREQADLIRLVHD